jgi:hypothetical protein
MKEEKILTRHPEGKKGVNISKEKYNTVKSAIVESFREKGELSYTELTKQVAQKLSGNFSGSIPWYVVTVKLDLEARGLIKKAPGTSPQKLVLAERE